MSTARQCTRRRSNEGSRSARGGRHAARCGHAALERGGILFLVFGLFNIADWLYGGMEPTFRLLTGFGFLLLAPEAFRNPIGLTTPLRQAFKPRPRASGWFDWAAGVGVVLLFAAIAVRWL